MLTHLVVRIGLLFFLVMWAFMGIGEGVAMPAMNNLLSKWIPVSEMSRSLALVYSGMYLGSVACILVFSHVLINNFGWPSVFYSFGSLGTIWFSTWLSKEYSSPKEDPHLSTEEKSLILGGSLSKELVSKIPLKKILSKAPVWALIISKFCHNWGTFIILTWMLTYYNQVVPHSRRETDSYNNETFGSMECASEDRAEHEGKIRDLELEDEYMGLDLSHMHESGLEKPSFEDEVEFDEDLVEVLNRVNSRLIPLSWLVANRGFNLQEQTFTALGLIIGCSNWSTASWKRKIMMFQNSEVGEYVLGLN